MREPTRRHLTRASHRADDPHRVQQSVWLTGQVCSRDQRRGRYLRGSLAHPGKMLPSVARYAVATYTAPGDLVLDPMAGIGTTTVEAVRLRRDAIGVEYERRWAALAAANLEHAAAHGATGRGEIIRGDARQLPELLPDHLHGQVALVLTSPPYGSTTHGHVREYGGRGGRVAKVNHRYGDDQRNLAHVSHDQLADGFTRILAGCVPLLKPDGYVVVTARPYRRHGTLVDIAGMVITAGTAAGLRLVDRCPALIAAIRNGKVVPRASFFQLRNVRAALANGDPQWLAQHETALVFQIGLGRSRIQPPIQPGNQSRSSSTSP